MSGTLECVTDILYLRYNWV